MILEMGKGEGSVSRIVLDVENGIIRIHAKWQINNLTIGEAGISPSQSHQVRCGVLLTKHHSPYAKKKIPAPSAHARRLIFTAPPLLDLEAVR